MIKLKHHNQAPGFCGPASLKMVMDFFGVDAAEEELARLSGTPAFEIPESTTIKGMAKAAKYFGFSVFYKEKSSIADLKYFISNNIPVIVRWFSGWWGHYSVAVDITEKDVVLEDPELKKVFLYVKKNIITKEKFLHVWFDFEVSVLKNPSDIMLRPMLVILPKKYDFKINNSLKMRRI